MIHALLFFSLLFLLLTNKNRNKHVIDPWFLCILALSFCFISILISKPSSLYFQELGNFSKPAIWLFMIYVLNQINLDSVFIKRLMFCFWWGMVISIFMTFFIADSGLQEGFYKTADGEMIEGNLSGRAMSNKGFTGCIPFVMILSLYWAKNNTLFKRLIFYLVIGSAIVFLFRSYQRTTQLAICMAIFYAVFVNLKNFKVSQLIGVTIAAVLLFSFLFTYGQNYLVRWMMVEEDGGSGRNEIQKVVIDYELNEANINAILFGVGISGIFNVTESSLGIALHTHSDFFDFWLGYGIIGLLVYLYIYYLFWRQTSTMFEKGSRELLLIRCAFVSLGVCSFVSGLMESVFTYSMFYVMIVYLCMNYIERTENIQLISRDNYYGLHN
ncbi:MAG: O-antigen ligase family protein [Planctomycetia bacterium]|nr:O-antigen ligase family protein [Planctomycetia bacterium]